MKIVLIKKEVSIKREICNHARYITNIWSQAKGLMFTFKFPECLIFDFKKEKMIQLHMFFVFYPIDVIFLNNNKRVVDFKENFLPFTFYEGKQKSRFVIEMKKGTIKKNKIQINDFLDFKE